LVKISATSGAANRGPPAAAVSIAGDFKTIPRRCPTFLKITMDAKVATAKKLCQQLKASHANDDLWYCVAVSSPKNPP
jgi:hypothetical protein